MPLQKHLAMGLHTGVRQSGEDTDLFLQELRIPGDSKCVLREDTDLFLQELRIPGFGPPVPACSPFAGTCLPLKNNIVESSVEPSFARKEDDFDSGDNWIDLENNIVESSVETSCSCPADDDLDDTHLFF